MDEMNRSRKGSGMECCSKGNHRECCSKGNHKECCSKENPMECCSKGNPRECCSKGNHRECCSRENSREYSRKENSTEYSRRENSREYSRKENGTECFGAENSSEYSRRENSTECFGAENRTEYSRRENGTECFGAENRTEYSRRENSTECFGAENSSEYSRRENSTECFGAENRTEYSRRENSTECFGAENRTEYSRRENSTECFGAENSSEYSRRENSTECFGAENRTEYSRRENSTECFGAENSSEYSRRENSTECFGAENRTEYSRRENSTECFGAENSSEYSRRENSTECFGAENRTEYSRRENSTECFGAENSSEYSRRENSTECFGAENRTEYSRRENSTECFGAENRTEYSRRENSTECFGAENRTEYSRAENRTGWYVTDRYRRSPIVVSYCSTGGRPVCYQVSVGTCRDTVVVTGRRRTDIHPGGGDVLPLTGCHPGVCPPGVCRHGVCHSALTAGPLTSRRWLTLSVVIAVAGDDHNPPDSDVMCVCVVTALPRQRPSEPETPSCGAFCPSLSERRLQFFASASPAIPSLHIFCLYRALHDNIRGETRSHVCSCYSGRRGLVCACDGIPQAGVSAGVPVFSSSGSVVARAQMVFPLLDVVVCVVIMVVIYSLSNARSRTENKKQRGRCDGSAGGMMSKKSPSCIKRGQFQMHVKELKDLTVARRPFTRAASAEAISDLLPLKTRSEKSPLWKTRAKLDPSHCLDDLTALQLLLLRCITDTTHAQRMGPREVEVRPVTRFLPDATRDPSRDLAHVGYRLATLGAFPPALDVSRVRLADAGFYSRGQRDEVICYSCRLHHSGWRPGDDPLTIHRHRSPQCEHVLQRDRDLAELTGNAARTAQLPGRGQGSEGQPGAVPGSSSQGAAPLCGGRECGDGGVSQPQPAQPWHQHHNQPSPLTAAPSASAAAVTVASCKGTASAAAVGNGTASSNSAASSGNNGTATTTHGSVSTTTFSTSSTTTYGTTTATPSNTGATTSATPTTTTTTSSSSSTVPVSSASTPAPGAAQGAPCARRPLFPQPRLQLGNAIHPSQCSVQSRRRSFTRWSETQAPPLEQLVLSGFFYAGYGDCVVCFYCGIRLKEWRQTDNVHVEHARHRPNCGYLREIKGDDFIRQVQGQPQTSGSTSSASAPTAPTSSSAPDAGCQGATAPHRPASTAVVTSPLPAASSSSSSLSSLPASSRGNQEAVIPRPEPPPPAAAAVVAGNGGNEGPHCRACRQRAVDTLVMPCGHLVLCEVCARTVRVCPLCGDAVRATAKVYRE